jgi:hypothetical protein
VLVQCIACDKSYLLSLQPQISAIAAADSIVSSPTEAKVIFLRRGGALGEEHV